MAKEYETFVRDTARLLNRRQVVGHDEYAPDRKQDPGELFEWARLGLPEG